MKTLEDLIGPDNDAFGEDPFGYATLGWHKWVMAQAHAGLPVDMRRGPTSEDFKSPALWLAHAHALTEAASVLLRGVPNLDLVPVSVRGVAHCQYHATILMLVGYSLEVSLKAMLIIKQGIAAYQADEKKHFHHSLDMLSEFIPDLSEKDKAILKGLTHFVRWAGRYPDPGFGREGQAEEIFTLSTHYRISAYDLFTLALRIVRHTQVIAAG